MKVLYLADGTNIVLDKETEEVSRLDSEREAIQRIYMIPEDMHVISQSYDGSRQEFDAKKDDIVITFYDKYFKNKTVVVNSADWAENLTLYKQEQQDQKESWAKAKAAANLRQEDIPCAPSPCENTQSI
jgi:septation ring formation regulator EzrA